MPRTIAVSDVRGSNPKLSRAHRGGPAVVGVLAGPADVPTHLLAAVAGGRVLIDRRAQFFKAVNWHEETAAHGASMTIPEYDAELAGMASIGANLIRNCVYPRHPYVYDWADRHGMLVLDDCDNMWLNLSQQKLQTESYGQSRAVATMMAWHQVNHPSVVMWCLQNESEVDNVTYRA
ncbi:MAG: glycoside hydrolase family 2 TIM barrel-domain containing protein [Umezawaea sp.]